LIIAVMHKRSKPGAVAVGDKTPRYTEFLNELRGLFPEARFLHVVRDPRDIAVSLFHHALRAGHSDALTSGSQTQVELATSTAQLWMRAQERFAHFIERYPEQCLEIKYEDLCREPRETMVRGFRFLGVSASADIVQSVVQRASFEALSGRKPGEEEKSSFFRKGIAGDWTRTLDRSMATRITAVCSPWLSRKGY
jgi:hypothetical protein